MIGKYEHKEIEKQIREYWKKIGLLQKLNEQNAKGEPYFLLDGPPYANNVPHIGHIRNTVYKDFYIRLAFMKGQKVLFQPGFDTHGLPIENVVEKKLELKSKKDIKELGIKNFCNSCKEVATEYKDVWIRTYDKLGSWYSWKTPYITYDNNYLESVWWSFKKMWEKGMVYEGKKPVFWCPKCETALAGYETTDSYADKEDPLIIVKFKVKNMENDHLLVFTTTPWTLPANVVLVAKPDAEYVKVKTQQGNLIIAKNLVKLLDDLKINYNIIETFKGKKLEGLEYEPLLDVPTQKELQKNPNALKVYMSIPILKERLNAKLAAKLGKKAGEIFEEFVSVDEGTGIVHCAPGHGKTDNIIGQHYNLPEISPLDDQCKFTEDAGIYQGKFVKDADDQIIEDLKISGKMLYNHKISHSYPLCWRCKSPLIFRMSNQWFLKVDLIKQKMLDANENVRWQPDFAGERFYSWVANAEDWNFSRQRFWGIPIPIWKSEDGYLKVIGSKQELEEELGKKLPENYDLHTVSEIKIKSKEGKELSLIGDIFDVWFDSGSAPFAAFHYPFENKELFEKHYPVNRINESQDQVRGWFYSLMFCGVATFDKAPYKTISMPAWVVDKDGEKLSKSLGNFISAEEGIDDYGADNIRFYYCSDIDPASLAKFNPETVQRETSKVHSILWNLHKLLITQIQAEKELNPNYQLNANLEKENLLQEDQWILSRIASTIQELKDYYEQFKLHLAGRALNKLIINDLSRTYIQLIRERLEDDKLPLSILYRATNLIIRIIAPISPHISDAIYKNIKDELQNLDLELKDSVHLEKIPGIIEEEKTELNNYANEHLEEIFDAANEIIGTILAARDQANIGIRWPIKEIIIETKSELHKKALKELNSVIKRATNTKQIIEKEGPKEYEIKTNFKALGEDYGQETGDVAVQIKQNQDKINHQLIEGKDTIILGKYELKKTHFTITIKPATEYVLGESKYVLTYLKKELDKEMMPEGYARETMRRIQVLRKNMELKKQDKITLKIQTDKELQEHIKKYEDQIKEKTGTIQIEFSDQIQQTKDILIDKIKGKEIIITAKNM
ncbi:isoleucine--tRNA ligase [Candidatus Woesearchaeota archaeon]|nr:isoleucine--tRNA ligase [Candidatus Woesearchaeota archaeon]